MVRHDWISLKNQFVIGNWLTVSDFFRDNQIKDNSRNRINTKGWIIERREYQEEVFKRTREQIIEKESEIRLRQQRHAQQLQAKGLKELENLPVKKIDDARKMIITGMQEERAALGISEKVDQPSSLTQVNVSFPRTRLDELLEDQDLEGLLKFIAEIKREKIRRSDERVENK